MNRRMPKAFTFLLQLDFWKLIYNLVCNRFLPIKLLWPLTTSSWPYLRRGGDRGDASCRLKILEGMPSRNCVEDFLNT